nr:HAD family hydrolase [Natronomonas gomsonensis]
MPGVDPYISSGSLRSVVLRAVAFDLDDTLAVTARDRETLLAEAADRADVALDFDREDYLAAHRKHSGTESRRPVFEALVGEQAPAVTRAYRAAVGEAMAPVDGAAETVEWLRERYRVGLLTDGPDRTQRDKLRRLGWTDSFDQTLVTGALGAPKPDAAAFASLCDALDVAPEEVAYVGDDPDRDVAGAAAAGLLAVQVTYDGGPAVHPDADASLSRDEISTLPALLTELVGDGTDDA